LTSIEITSPDKSLASQRKTLLMLLPLTASKHGINRLPAASERFPHLNTAAIIRAQHSFTITVTCSFSTGNRLPADIQGKQLQCIELRLSDLTLNRHLFVPDQRVLTQNRKADVFYCLINFMFFSTFPVNILLRHK